MSGVFIAERLDESLYSVRSLLSLAAPLHELSQVMGIPSSEHSCLPVTPQGEMKALSLAAVPMPPQNLIAQGDLFSDLCFYVDMDSSNEFQAKVSSWLLRELVLVIIHFVNLICTCFSRSWKR